MGVLVKVVRLGGGIRRKVLQMSRGLGFQREWVVRLRIRRSVLVLGMAQLVVLKFLLLYLWEVLDC